MDHKTDKFWFLREPILVRAAWHTERGVSKKWTRLCYPRVPVVPVVSCSYHALRQKLQHALSTTPNGAHPTNTEPVYCTPSDGWGSKASTAELTLAVSSDLDDALLTYFPIWLCCLWLNSDQPGVYESLQRWKNEYKWLKREEDLQKERWWIWACVYFWWAKSNVCKGSLLQSGERRNSRLEDLKR